MYDHLCVCVCVCERERDTQEQIFNFNFWDFKKYLKNLINEEDHYFLPMGGMWNFANLLF